MKIEITEAYRGFTPDKPIDELNKCQLTKYLHGNSKECQHCKIEKNLFNFYNKETHEIPNICNKCKKKITEENAVNIVMDLLRKENLI